MNISKEKDDKYEKLVLTVNQTICKNLESLLKARNLTQRKFCKLLAAEKTSITRSYFCKILKNPKYISAAFLLSCCDFFGITLNNLVSTDFNADEYIYNNTEEHQDYFNIKNLLEQSEKTETITQKTSDTKLDSNLNLMTQSSDLWSLLGNTNLITDPTHIQFDGYIQDYYCYYYPTHSSENKKEENILKGILHFEPESHYCKATLKIDTNTINDAGNINYKEYTGYAAISTTVDSLNCILYSDSLCEFCFLMFRHFKLNFENVDCRIAEVLSSSSAAEERRPTVLRMLLSKEKIDDKDLKVIAPAFSLNYSTIAISEDNLRKTSNDSNVYNKIINDLINTNTSKPTYFCKENDVFTLALKHLKNKESTLEFLMHLRANSYAYRYNKVSMKADSTVREILLSKGYYKKRLKEETANKE